AVHRAVRRLRDGGVLPLQQAARADDLRRPLQARRVVPRDFAALAAATGTRGLPGRRLLPPLAPARTGGEALGQERRRVADVASDHRDAGGGGLPPHSPPNPPATTAADLIWGRTPPTPSGR